MPSLDPIEACVLTSQLNSMVSLVAWLSEYGPKIQTLSQALDSTLTRLTKVLPDDWNCRVISSDSSEVGELHEAKDSITRQ